MSRIKPVITRTSEELARALGIKSRDAHEWEVQANLLAKLRDVIAKHGLTHAQVAKKAGSSRTRVTSVLNGNLKHVSTDLLIRFLGSLGYAVTVSVSRVKIAA